MNRIIALLLLAMLLGTLASCFGGTAGTTGSVPAVPGESGAASGTAVDAEVAGIPAGTISVEYDADDLDASVDGSDISTIELQGDTIAYDGGAAEVHGSVITITAGGTYRLQGALEDGQIVVDTTDKETVRLILNGADIHCSTSAPIYVLNAEKTVITLADGTDNRVADGAVYVLVDAESDEPNAAIFSHDDLAINGNGSLTVDASYNNGIASKDDLKITGGTITVNAVHDGIKGKDSLVIRDGTLTVTAGADGLQSHNDTDAEKGYVVIEGGTLQITAGLDGIQAETRLVVSGGDLTVFSGGGSINGASHAGNPGGWDMDNNASQSTTASTKGVKAGVDVTITGGTIHVDSADDAIHSNGSLAIDGGDFVLSSGDDGIHSDTTLIINGGDVRIIKSYEGLESAKIVINGGSIHVVSSDDAINASSGGGDMGMAGQPGPGEFAGDNSLAINDGYIYVDANGDGLDVNGPVTMAGGVVLVNGPTSDGNGALDYTGSFQVTGGLLVAVGSAGMAQAPSATSTQYAVMVNLPSQQPAGTMVHIASQDGEEVLTLQPTKAYQSVVLCSADLENGVTYVVYTGGSSTGTAADGLYAGGTYTAGTESAGFTISGIVTVSGSYSGGFPGGGPGGRPGRPGP